MNSEPDLRVFPNLETLSKVLADCFASLVKEITDEGKSFYLVLSGGSTPQTLYRLLSTPPYATNIPWKKIHFFWGDERCVSPQSEVSNYKQAYQLLLSKVQVPDDNIHRIKGEIEPIVAASDYKQTLRKFANHGREWPKFDLVFLGLGSDGHTASLFPGKIPPLEMQEPVITVKADYEDRPADRVSLTPLVLNDALNIIFLVSGTKKARALKTTTTGPWNPEALPAQRVHPTNGRVKWMVDKAAASELQQR